MKKVTVFDTCMSGAAYTAETSQSIKLVLQFRDPRIIKDVSKAIQKAIGNYGFNQVTAWDENSKGETIHVYM